ncbi:MAG: GAF and ANTAR domain-containing protein [Nocardioidaceae bacterium]|nr:GAF and ANTAR domain-containing protein [Nocardioidaceae bacterium]
MIPAEHLSDIFVEMADSLVDDFDLVDFLQNLTVRAVEVSGAASAGLLLADHHDDLHYMAASSDSGRLLELFQLQNEEGPCLDCFRTRVPVVNSDLREASERWPLFAPRALSAGFRSVHAFPMRLRDRVVGALNIFGSEDAVLAPEDVRVVQALADVATIAILQEQAITNAGTLTEQLQSALNTRLVIEQAKGAIGRAQRIDVDAAFDLLRRYARSRRVAVREISLSVLNDPTGDAARELLGPA